MKSDSIETRSRQCVDSILLINSLIHQLINLSIVIASIVFFLFVFVRKMTGFFDSYPPGGGTLGISGWGCADGTLEPLTFTEAHTYIANIW